MSRKGVTLVELLIAVLIIVILGAMIVGAVGGCRAKGPTGQSFYDTETTSVFRCVKTYTSVSGGGETSTTTSKRVDLKPEGGGPTITICCDDDWQAGIDNSATLFAQFEQGGWYEIEYIGFRKEGYYSYFPLVKSVREVPQ